MATDNELWQQTEAAELAERSGGRPSESVPVLRVRGEGVERATDAVAAEEPLEIRLHGDSVAVTMRTPSPGEDAELAAGFLTGEAIVSAADLARVNECRSPGGDGGIADVWLRPGSAPAAGWQRNFCATSSCGICGKASIDAVKLAAPPVPDGPLVAREVIGRLPDMLRTRQRVFERTGGLHAAGLFDAAGGLEILREESMEDALAAGHASFWLEGEKLHGGWSLRRTDGRRWLLVKRRDEHADSGDPVSERPESVVSGRTIEGKRLRMPPRGVKKGTKRARQYEKVKKSVKQRGASEDRAEEIAARTVNKERARSGESRTRSRTSTQDISSGRRGGKRSGSSGPKGRTRDQLYNEAKQLNVEGRSRMNKSQLQRAVDNKKR